MKRALALIMLVILCQCPLYSASAQTEVELWHYFESSHDKEMIEELVDEYNRLQDRIVITANYISRQEMMSKYTTGAISGKLPDIGMADSPDMAYFISLGTFLDITDDLKAWDELDQFYTGPLSSCMEGDRLYGLPHNSSCLCLAVNLDLLKEAGYDHMPTNRAEFAEMAAAMTDPDNDIYGFAMSCIDTEEGTFQMLPWLSNGERGLSGLTSPSAAEGLECLGALFHNGCMNPECVAWNQADAWYNFCEGKAAMVECGTWHLSMTDQIQGAFDYGFCLLPTGAEGETTSVIGGENIGICAGCVDEQECVAFIEWLCSKENVAAWSLGAGKLPPRGDCKVDYPYEQKGFEVFREEMQYAQARGPHAEWPNISNAVNQACQSVFMDDVAPAIALGSVAEVIEPIIRG